MNSPATDRTFEDSPDYVQSLARGLQVIRAFSQERPAMSLSEVAERTGLTRAAARRFLHTLEHLGYVARHERQFRLTPRVLELGYAYLSALDISDIVLPLMKRLAERLDQSCSLSVLDGDEIVYLARVPVRKIMTVALGVGARLPAFATSMGRVLLSGLSEAARDAVLSRPLKAWTPQTETEPARLKTLIRAAGAQGYALVDQELEPGLCALAVPVHDRRGRIVAALNVGLPWQEGMAARAPTDYLPALKATAAEIERATAQHSWGYQP